MGNSLKVDVTVTIPLLLLRCRYIVRTAVMNLNLKLSFVPQAVGSLSIGRLINPIKSTKISLNSVSMVL